MDSELISKLYDADGVDTFEYYGVVMESAVTIFFRWTPPMFKLANVVQEVVSRQKPLFFNI